MVISKVDRNYVSVKEAVNWINEHIRNYIEKDNFLRIYDFVDDFENAMKKIS